MATDDPEKPVVEAHWKALLAQAKPSAMKMKAAKKRVKALTKAVKKMAEGDRSSGASSAPPAVQPRGWKSTPKAVPKRGENLFQKAQKQSKAVKQWMVAKPIVKEIVAIIEGMLYRSAEGDDYEPIGRACLAEQVNICVEQDHPVLMFLLGFPWKAPNRSR